MENLNQIHWGPELVGAFLAALVGALVALITLVLSRLSDRKKEAELEIHREFTIYNQKPNYVYRLGIKNIGKYTAKCVEAEIVNLKTGSKSITPYVPGPLNWMHRDTSERNILPLQTAYLDILNYVPNGQMLRIESPRLWGLPRYSRLKQGKSELDLQIVLENGKTINKSIIINWAKSKKPTITVK